VTQRQSAIRHSHYRKTNYTANRFSHRSNVRTCLLNGHHCQHPRTVLVVTSPRPPWNNHVFAFDY